MNRVCFTIRVKPTAMEEYKAHHRHVWPKMLDALSRTGWHNYSLFMDGDGLLVGYFETPHTFDECLSAMASEPINTKWQELMAPYFEGEGEHADRMMVALSEIFHLP
jgi:L-rhamnose mutarotase